MRLMKTKRDGFVLELDGWGVESVTGADGKIKIFKYLTDKEVEELEHTCWAALFDKEVGNETRKSNGNP